VAVTQLDQMTQQNAALVEESAAAAESLREQAQRLAGVVATFRLESASAASIAPASAPASVAPSTARVASPAMSLADAAIRKAKAPVPVKPVAAPATPASATPPVSRPVKPATVADDDWESF